MCPLLMFQQSSSLVLLKFQMEEEAGNYNWKYVKEKRCTSTFCIVNCIGEELNITNVCYGKQARKQHKCMCLFISIIKDEIAKGRSLGIRNLIRQSSHFL